MSDTPCLDSTDNILGQEFLTWLWYQSDVAPGAFVDKEGQPYRACAAYGHMYKKY